MSMARPIQYDPEKNRERDRLVHGLERPAEGCSLNVEFSPGGRFDKSPAVHCRVGVRSGASPEGTVESSHVSRTANDICGNDSAVSSSRPTAFLWLRLSLTFLFVTVATPLLAASVDYSREVKPILAENCYKCHGAAQRKGGLRLDTAALAVKGGERGAAIKPGKSAESPLIQAIKGTHPELPRMPHKRPPLTDAQIASIEQWIEQGVIAPANEEPDKGVHWSFAPPQHAKPPSVRQTNWPRNPIDEFILARLEMEDIKPSAQAERSTLIRRVSLDLTGLPPTPAEVDAFLNDGDSTAYESLVERLLASPHYGERWGRWWLDAARYADSNGYSIDSMRSIWPYRDWVVSALNQDLPFHQFTIWQLAGDLLPNPTQEQLIATGFHRNTQVNHEGGIDLEQFRVESAVDRVNTTATVWLGLTLACAQCHDHKFDPLTQREYYRFFAFFNQQENDGHGNAALEAINTFELGSPEELTALAKYREEFQGREKELNEWVEKELKPKQPEWETGLDEGAKKKLKPEVVAVLAVPAAERNEFQVGTAFNAFRDQDSGYRVRRKALDQFKKREPKVTTSLIMKDRSELRETHVMIKGDFTRPGVTVEPGTPAVLHPFPGSARASRAAFGTPPEAVASSPSSERNTSTPVLSEASPAHEMHALPNRLDLAEWLISRENPLTARVIMNRVWHQYFGKGLVETDNDFGLQGTRPTHPELLDWLATEFMERGWSLKAMHRLIVSSATYRQASVVTLVRAWSDSPGTARALTSAATIDPLNRLLWRQNRIRLDAELIRDVSLTASGLLERRLGGPPVFPPQPDGLDAFTQNKREWKTSTGGDRFRRGLYTHIQRTRFHPALAVFDAPDSYTACTRRLRSNTPLQALTLLNDHQFVELAEGLASRLEEQAGNDAAKLDFAFRCCLARPPTNSESERLQRLLSTERSAQPSEMAAWTTIARVLLNLDEMVTRE